MASVSRKDKHLIDSLEPKVKLQRVETSSQVRKPRYSTHLRFGEGEEEEEEEKASQGSPIQIDFEVNTPVNPQLLTIHTKFIIDIRKPIKRF